MKFKKTAVVLGASALVALAGPAMAAPPYTIGVGTSTSGAHAFSASAGTISFSVAHGSGTVNLGCTSGSANGSVTAGTSSTGLGVGSIASSTWNGCIGPGGLAMNVTQPTAWSLNLTGTASTGTSDNVAGYVGAVNAHVASALTSGGVPLCSFDVVGSADAILHESGQSLQIAESAGNLVLDNVSGCFGAVANDDVASFATTYAITSPDGAISVR